MLHLSLTSITDCIFSGESFPDTQRNQQELGAIPIPKRDQQLYWVILYIASEVQCTQLISSGDCFFYCFLEKEIQKEKGGY